MKDLKVPVFESYQKLQEKAKEEAYYLNSVIAPQLRARNIVLTLEILAEASEKPECYSLEDTNKNRLKPYQITSRKYLSYNGGVSLDKKVFESWYHTVHPDGIERAKFFKGLCEKERELLRYYEYEH